MNVKRQNSLVLPSGPSLLNAITGFYYTIPYSKDFNIGRSSLCVIMIDSSFISRCHCTIKYENNKFIIYDHKTLSGTYINYNRILGGKSNFVVLNHGDLISFGTENNMKFIYRFQLPPNPDKRPKFDNNYAVPDILTLSEKYKNSIKKLHSEILDLKVEHLVFKNNVKTQITEFQKIIQESLKYTSKCLIGMISKQECSIESFKAQVYALLEDNFQCPICNEVMIKASITYCNHTFCQRCLSQWLAKSKNCPVCRTSLKTTNHFCLSIDNYITDLCDLLGGKAKEQRDILLKEMIVSESSGNKSKKRRSTQRNQSQVARSFHINLRARIESEDVVDLTYNSPS